MDNKQQKEEVKQAVRQELNRYGLKTFYASSFLSIPFTYVTYLLIRGKFSEDTVVVIGVGVYLLVLTVISRLIRKWLYKKPSTSSWYGWLD